MPLEISAWIATATFIVLVIAFILVMLFLVKKLRLLALTATDIRNDISRLSNELTVLVKSTDETIKVIQDSMNAANHVMHATKQISQSISRASQHIEEITHTAAQKANKLLAAEQTNQQLEEAVQWAELALSAWRLWQQGRDRL